MHVLLFGATGMIGQGVLHACLADPGVTTVTAIGRTPTGRAHAKLREIVTPDVTALRPHEGALADVDACFFCLGVSSAGMTEARYAALTFDLTLAVARTLASLRPAMTFVYVSGVGTDATERGRTMWARVKGRTENALLALFPAAYMFRPGFVQALPGTTSRTPLYRVLYAVGRPIFPLLRRLFPTQVLSADQIGRAMLSVARHGHERRVLEPPDIVAAAAR